MKVAVDFVSFALDLTALHLEHSNDILEVLEFEILEFEFKSVS